MGSCLTAIYLKRALDSTERADRRPWSTTRKLTESSATLVATKRAQVSGQAAVRSAPEAYTSAIAILTDTNPTTVTLAAHARRGLMMVQITVRYTVEKL